MTFRNRGHTVVDEVIGAKCILKRLNSGEITNAQWIGCTSSNMRRQTIWSKGTHVTNHGKVEWRRVTSLASRGKGKRIGKVPAPWHIVIQGVGLEIMNLDLVVVCG